MRQHAFGLVRDGRFDVRVFASEDAFTAEDRKAWAPIRVTTHPQFGPRMFGFTPRLIGDLLAAELDCLHLHGIWMYPSLAGAAWAARTKRPYLISPHGMLESWIISRGRWKKAAARVAYEQRSWRAASLFHALTAAEAADIRRTLEPLGVTARIATIPNGVAAAPGRCARRAEPPMMLYLGRIHPKKNLAALIEAWTAGRCGRAARLTIAGWGDAADVAALEALLTAAADPSVAFVGPAYGEAKATLLETARFLILPSLSEGLPMTVLEGWAAGTPSLMTAACNLPEGFAAGAALEIPTTAGQMVAALVAALDLPVEKWEQMSRAAQSLARTRFGADLIAARWGDLYEGLAGRPHAVPPARLIA